MSEALAKNNVTALPQHSLVKTMATRYGLEADKFLATLKGTIFPSGKVPTNEQIAAFLIVANEYDLNPFVKEIYAFPTQNGGITPVVPIDGWAATTNKNPMYDGVEFSDVLGEAGNLIAVTCRIFRKDRSHPTEVTEYMSECKRNTPTWSQWPARMLRHKAFIQCARLAFSLSGIYDPDEAERLASVDGNNGTNSAATGVEGLKDRLPKADPPQDERSDFVAPEVTAPEPVDEDPIDEVIEGEIVDPAESNLADLITLAKDKLKEVSGNKARTIQEILNGRKIDQMDLKAVNSFLDELEKIEAAQG